MPGNMSPLPMIPEFKLDFWLHSLLKESVSKWKALEKEGLPCARTECGNVECTVHASVLVISDAKQSCSQPRTGGEKLVFIKFIPDTWEPQESVLITEN